MIRYPVHPNSLCFTSSHRRWSSSIEFEVYDDDIFPPFDVFTCHIFKAAICSWEMWWGPLPEWVYRKKKVCKSPPYGFVWKCWVYSQWNSHLIGIMIMKTIGFRATLFSDTPIYLVVKTMVNKPWMMRIPILWWPKPYNSDHGTCDLWELLIKKTVKNSKTKT